MVDIDAALSILENRIRRDLLERLVREPHYPLQLSQQLGVSQQAIMKHLKILEDAGFVQSTRIPSDKGGPPKKSYCVQQSISLRFDMGPDLFRIEQRKLPPGGPVRLSSRLPPQAKPVAEQVGGRKKLGVSEGMALLSELSEALEELDKQRDAMIALHQQVLSRVSDSVEQTFDDYEERRLVHTLLKEPQQTFDIRSLSDDLNIGTSHIEEMLSEVQRRMLRELAGKGGQVVAAPLDTNLPWWAALGKGKTG